MACYGDSFTFTLLYADLFLEGLKNAAMLQRRFKPSTSRIHRNRYTNAVLDDNIKMDVKYEWGSYGSELRKRE
jgi:hypothetical protein